MRRGAQVDADVGKGSHMTNIAAWLSERSHRVLTIELLYLECARTVALPLLMWNDALGGYNEIYVILPDWRQNNQQNMVHWHE